VWREVLPEVIPGTGDYAPVMFSLLDGEF